MDARVEAAIARELDENDPFRGSAPMTPDAVLRVWASQTLAVELSWNQPILPSIRNAFSRAQAMLWDGTPVVNPVVLLDGDTTRSDG